MSEDPQLSARDPLVSESTLLDALAGEGKESAENLVAQLRAVVDGPAGRVYTQVIRNIRERAKEDLVRGGAGVSYEGLEMTLERLQGLIVGLEMAVNTWNRMLRYAQGLSKEKDHARTTH